MFFLYYIWFFFFKICVFFKKNIDVYYINESINNFRDRDIFRNLNIFKKFFLVLFYEKNLFNKYFLNLYDEKNIVYFRRRAYPKINNFFLIKNKVNFKKKSLSKIIKQFIFLKKFNFFHIFKKINFFKNINNEFLIFFIFKKILNQKYLILWNDYNNTILYSLFLKNMKGNLIFFNLENYNQWFSYCFNKKLKKNLFKNKNFLKDLEDLFRLIFLLKFLILLKKYNKFYKIFKKNIFFFFFNFNKLKNSKIIFSKNWNIKNNYKIRFKETSLNKYINLSNISNFSIMYLRKNKVFNKSRYSRNRQLYRTGVYWCIWLNIIFVFGLYFIFYRFLFNFGYIWWGIFILLYSSIFSRVLKYNFHNIYFVIKEIKSFTIWVGIIFNNFINNFFNFLKYFFYKVGVFLLKNKNLQLINFFKKFINFFFKKFNYRDSTKIVEFWHGLKEKDTSFLRYKSIIHWTKLFFKVLFY